MAENTYTVYVYNDTSGNLSVSAMRTPGTIPSCASSGKVLGVPYIETAWTNGAQLPLTYPSDAATNAAPIVLTVASGHGIVANDFVYTSGIAGNAAANGTFQVASVTSTTITLLGSKGSGAYVGTAAAPGYVQKMGTTKNLFNAFQAGVLACQADKAAGN